AEACDKGAIELVDRVWFNNIAATLEKDISPKRKFDCQNCGHIWEVDPCTEGGKHGYEIACPKCGSMKKIKIDEDGQKHICNCDNHNGHGHGGSCCGH
ncbi:MAG: hypothetical protein Q8909_20800, partial [Bacteroidota bacterium]|nr:hypothetical protein [Bacteroidota bacterium]